jgi:hypothetical protein
LLDYTHKFKHKSWIKGETSVGEFWFDFKNTHDPFISNGYADFRFTGELGAIDHKGCHDYSPEPLYWYGDHIESQLVISETAATCAAASISKTALGKFHLNQKSLATILRQSAYKTKLDTSTVKNMLSIFEEKLGPDVPLTFDLSYRDMKVEFIGETHDIALNYMLQIRVHQAGANNMNLTKS